MIDWNNEYKPFANGMMQHKTTGEVKSRMMPAPKPLAPENPSYDMVMQSYEIVKSYMNPPTNEQFFNIFKELRLHTIEQNLSEDDFGKKMCDYHKDLKEYPYSLLKEVAREWRNKPKSPLYFPTIGQLKEAMHRRLYEMQRTKRRIEVLLGIEEEKPKQHASVMTMLQELIGTMKA